MQNLYPTMSSGIKLSSAGLVYAHYGKEIIKVILGPDTKSEVIDVVWKKVYDGFICEIDAIDNGISQTDEEPRYKFVTNLSNRVASLNVPWNNPLLSESTQFSVACQLVKREFVDTVEYFAKTWWPARNIVRSALFDRNRKSIASSQIIVLPQFCPWIGHLLELEVEMKIKPTIKFALFTDRDNSWRVRAVPETSTSFGLRNPLKEEWRGVRDEQLSVLADIPGCLFVHSTGFIGANLTKDGAMQMALKSLSSP